MAHIDLEITYSMRLTNSEFRLVTLGLANKLNSRDDVREALALNEKLCELRARIVAQLSDVSTGAHARASELRAAGLSDSHEPRRQA